MKVRIKITGRHTPPQGVRNAPMNLRDTVINSRATDLPPKTVAAMLRNLADQIENGRTR